MRLSTIRRLVSAALLMMAVGAVCFVSIAFTRDVVHVATIWPSNGLVIGILLCAHRSWKIVGVANFVGNIVASCLCGDSLGTSLAFAACNLLEISIAAYSLRLYIDESLVAHKIAKNAAAISLCVLGAPIVPSLIGAWVATSVADVPNFWSALRTWYPADMLGIVVLTPLVLLLASRDFPNLFRGPHCAKRMLSIAAFIVVTCGVFSQQDYPLLFLTFPPLLMLLFQLELAGAVIGLALLAFLSLGFTFTGHGPLLLAHTSTAFERVSLVQFFVGVAALTAYPVGNLLVSRRMLQNATKRRERQYRTLSENSTDIIVSATLDGIRNYVSPSVRDVLGWHPDEILGKARVDLLHPEDRPLFAEEQQQLLHGTRSARLQYRYQHKAGHFVWMESSSRVTRGTGLNGEDEVVKVIRDINARKTAEEALSKNEADLRAVTDNVPALIAFVDRDNVVRFANRTHKTWLGLEAEQLVGLPLPASLGAGNPDQASAFAQALAGQTAQFEWTVGSRGNRRRTRVEYVPRKNRSGVVTGIVSIMTDFTAAKEAEEKLSRLARFDTLTGLANRHEFNESIERALREGRDERASIGLLYLDVDHFKTINDTHGHAVGDEVLCEVGFRLMTAVRGEDLAVRLAGDEFVALIIAPSRVAVRAVAQRIQDAMRKPMHLSCGQVQVSTSVGGVYSKTCNMTSKQLLQCADDSLYRAKDRGRNNVVVQSFDAWRDQHGNADVRRSTDGKRQAVNNMSPNDVSELLRRLARTPG